MRPASASSLNKNLSKKYDNTINNKTTAEIKTETYKRDRRTPYLEQGAIEEGNECVILI